MSIGTWDQTSLDNMGSKAENSSAIPVAPEAADQAKSKRKKES
jgi:hypothetical protein